MGWRHSIQRGKGNNLLVAGLEGRVLKRRKTYPQKTKEKRITELVLHTEVEECCSCKEPV